MLAAMNNKKKAVVLLSGGVDSATALAIAQDMGFSCHALSFDYGQRHIYELQAARKVATTLEAVDHRVVKIDLRGFGGSALTDEIAVPKDRSSEVMAGEIPITYVPARNTIFLSFALAYAEVLTSADIFIGVNAIDYSGYPDCRPQYIEAFQNMANLATKMGVEGQHITIHTPLIELTKMQIIQRGIELGIDYSQTFSCYDPQTDDESTKACGHCDSCLLRAEGFRQAGVEDGGIKGVVT